MKFVPFLTGEVSTTSMGSELNTGLTSNITPSGIISEFVDILPWVGAMVGAAFLVYEARKLLKGSSKAKLRV